MTAHNQPYSCFLMGDCVSVMLVDPLDTNPCNNEALYVSELMFVLNLAQRLKLYLF